MRRFILARCNVRFDHLPNIYAIASKYNTPLTHSQQQKIPHACARFLGSTRSLCTQDTFPTPAVVKTASMVIAHDTLVTLDNTLGNTTSDTNQANPVSTSTPSRTSLQGLPPELRNNIYKYVAASEDRFVLGKKIVCPRKATESLITHFHSAVALHPLAMTCRQMRDEFTGIHLAATEPRWVMVVNNFDLEQIEKFAEVLDRGPSDGSFGDASQNPGHFKIVDWQSYLGYLHMTPVYSPNIVLRFQMDENAMRSVWRLREDVLKGNGTAPFPLFLNRYSSLKGGAFGIAEIVTDCSPGRVARARSVRGLPFDQAVEIEAFLRDLRNEVTVLRYSICGNVELPDSFEYMQQCWFDPFFSAVRAMREVHFRVSRTQLFVGGMSKYVCLCCLGGKTIGHATVWEQYCEHKDCLRICR
jgi:hypothetical protein